MRPRLSKSVRRAELRTSRFPRGPTGMDGSGRGQWRLRRLTVCCRGGRSPVSGRGSGRTFGRKREAGRGKGEGGRDALLWVTGYGGSNCGCLCYWGLTTALGSERNPVTALPLPSSPFPLPASRLPLLLPPQPAETLLQFRRPPRRIIGKASRPGPRPQLSVLALRLRRAIGITLVDPLALRLLEPVFEIRSAGLPRL